MSVRILHGDCLDLLPTLEAESVHACVTDPPYGIGFMDKKWDTFKPVNVMTAAETKQRKDPQLLVELPNVYGRKRSPAQSPSSVSYDETITGHRHFQAWCEQWAREVFRVLKPGGHLLCSGAPRSHHRMTCGIEDAGFEIRDAVLWLFGQGFPKSHNLKGEWDGWGTALKPAWEPVILARKPFKGTVANNVQAHGCGALNIDACRIEGEKASGSYAPPMKFGGQNSRPFHDEQDGERQFEEKPGRWPANVIHDGSEVIVAEFPSEAGAFAPVRGDEPSMKTRGIFGKFDERTPGPFHDERGSAARFYYVPKADRADRDEGLEELPLQTVDVLAGHRSRRMEEVKRPDGADPAQGRNTHPTVKPTDLMRYLCRLITPPGGVVLDPFMGSGSTGKAAELEGFSFVGIEREAEYVEIAKRRIGAGAPLFKQQASA